MAFVMRCYLMNDGHIAAVELLENALDDASAIREATAIFIGRMGKFQGFEVWDQGRFVYRCLDEVVPAKAIRAVRF
jgi:hypothetical protein